MTPREFTKSLDDLISSPGQRLIGDIVNGYKYEGDKIMYGYDSEARKLRDIVLHAAKRCGVNLDIEFDGVRNIQSFHFYKRSEGFNVEVNWPYSGGFETAVCYVLEKLYRGFGNNVSICRNDKPKIEKVIFNDPATIVMWADGTKTVVKAVDEGFDPEKGLAMAISKKALGNEGNYYNTIRKYLDEYYEEVECLYTKIDIVTASKNAAENLGKLKEAINKNFGVPGYLIKPEADK